MLKKFVISMLSLMLLVGCGSSDNTSAVDINKSCDEIYNELGFSATKLSLDQAKGILFLGEEVVDANVYLANDNTSSIVAIIESEDVDKTKEALLAYQTQLVNMANAYSPEELEQINNAYLKSNDKYLVFIISSNNDSVINIADSVLGIN